MLAVVSLRDRCFDRHEAASVEVVQDLPTYLYGLLNRTPLSSLLISISAQVMGAFMVASFVH